MRREKPPYSSTDLRTGGGAHLTMQIFLFVLLVPILIWAFNTFDNLIRLEYEQFHQHWISDGLPSGLYWRPPDYRPSFRSGMATQKSMLFLLIGKPEWVESSDYASRLQRKYRILVLTWNACLVLWFLARGFFP